jgi:hypothetical protein
MANSWSKQPVWVGGYINNVNDSVIGGQITTVPSNVYATQAEQTLPGDHVVLDDASAQAKSTNAAGYATCYGGYYQYVLVDSSASTFYLGQAMYWKNTSDISGPYTVTNVQSGNYSNLAGVLLNPNVTAGNYTWIQCLGRATVLIDAASAAISIATPLYLSASTGTSNGSFTATAPSQGIVAFVGYSEQAVSATPTAGTTALIDLKNNTYRF